jgi:hypothetical protein
MVHWPRDRVDLVALTVGMMQAINRHRVKESNTSRETTHWGKRKLRRDE